MIGKDELSALINSHTKRYGHTETDQGIALIMWIDTFALKRWKNLNASSECPNKDSPLNK